MRWLSMGGRLNQKKYIYTAAVALVIIIILVVWFLHSNNKKGQPVQSSNSGPSNAMLSSIDNSAAQKAISANDYKTAVDNYIEAANLAEADNKYGQAESILKDAIKKIPDNQVPWIIYNDLVGVAEANNDKQLEISSLKKAIIKAQEPNSGAPASIVAIYNKMLKQLGAS